MWDQFFDPVFFLKGLGIQNLTGTIVDMGCGYGTFTIPGAQLNQGVVYALDIENEMIVVTKEKASKAGLKNVHAVQRDFMVLGTGTRRWEWSVRYAVQHSARRGTIKNLDRS